MPKMKSRRNARFRFKVTATGKVLRHQSNCNHILAKKSSKRKRFLRKSITADAADVPRIRRMLLA